MENRLNMSDAGNCYDCSTANVFFALVVIGSLFPAIYIHPKYFWITGIAYILCLVESLLSQTNRFLKNIMKVSDLTLYLMTLGAAPPHIKFWIQNYHMEERVH
jgi:hypothetical protein